MKVLIIGGAGYIGSACANYFCQHNHEVVVLDDLSTGSKDFLIPSIKLIAHDARDKAFLTQLMSKEHFDGVILLAAKIKVGESMEQPWLYFDNNISILNAVLAAMIATDTKNIIFSSTGSIYGNDVVVPIKEEAPLSPQSVYTETKLIAERILKWYQKTTTINSVIFRYFNASGSDGRCGMIPPLSHIIPIASEVALGKRPELIIFGGDYPTKDGTCIRDYVHVSDLGSAHLVALEKMINGTLRNEIFNLGREYPSSVLDIVKAFEAVGYPLKYRIGERRPLNADAVEQYASSEKAHRLLGWSAKMSLEEIIKSDIEFRKKLN